jgi:hypothetical protein
VEVSGTALAAFSTAYEAEDIGLGLLLVASAPWVVVLVGGGAVIVASIWLMTRNQ